MIKKRLAAFVMAVTILVTGNSMVSAGDLSGMGALSEASGEMTEGAYTYTVNGGCATITGYTGTENEVVTPTSLGGYPVTEIGYKAFYQKEMTFIEISEGVINIQQYSLADCKNLSHVNLPSTVSLVYDGAFTLDNALSQIKVNEKNRNYYDNEGVLFKVLEKGSLLYKYPASRKSEEYVVPRRVTDIAADAFESTINIKNIYIPNTVTTIMGHAFLTVNNPINIYLNHDVAPDVQTSAIKHAKDDIHVIVKSQSVADEINKKSIFYECGNSSVLILGTEGYPVIPTTSLTWDGSKTTEAHRIAPGEKCQLDYVQEPLNSTDNITWSSSDEDIAKVDAITGLVEASGGVNYPLQTGTCTITGTDESGHSIKIDMTVDIPVSEMVFPSRDIFVNQNVRSKLEVGEKEYITADIKPAHSLNAANVQFKSSNSDIATIQSDKESSGIEKQGSIFCNYAEIQAINPGTTTITATLNDNGTIWTRSFALTVTKAISDCTISPIGDQTYTGTALTPGVTVYDGNKLLVEETDYTVSYRDNTAVGAGEAVISGKGLYSGTAAITFRVVPSEDSGSDSDHNEGHEQDDNGQNNKDQGGNQENDGAPVQRIQSITGVKSSYQKAYGSKAFTLRAKAKGAVSYTSSNSRVAAVNKKNGKVTIKGTGMAIITITAAANASYKKAVKKTAIYVVPKKERITYAKSKKKGQLTIRWRRDTGASGYQIQYSTNSKFKGAGMTTVKTNRIVGRTIGKLKRGKKYFVRVRAYKNVKLTGGVTSKRGAWSKNVRVTV